MFDNDQIREMTKQGYTVMDIAKHLEVNYVKLLNHCIDEGLPHIRKRGKYDQFIYENYGKLSFREMGEAHGVSSVVMRKRAVVLGIHTGTPPPSRSVRQPAFMQYVTIRQAEEIKELRESGLPIREVCRKMPSVRNWVVDKFIKYYDHQTPESRRLAKIEATTQAFIVEHGDTLIEMGKQGCTTLEMVEKTGGDRKVIWNFLYKGGHTFKRTTGKRKPAKQRATSKRKPVKRRTATKPTKRQPPRPQMSSAWKLALGIQA